MGRFIGYALSYFKAGFTCTGTQNGTELAGVKLDFKEARPRKRSRISSKAFDAVLTREDQHGAQGVLPAEPTGDILLQCKSSHEPDPPMLSPFCLSHTPVLATCDPCKIPYDAYEAFQGGLSIVVGLQMLQKGWCSNMYT